MTQAIRNALDTGDPLDMLGLVSLLIEVATPDRLPFTKPDPRLDDLVSALIDVQIRETTALLAVLGELLVDDEGLQRRCRQEVALRADLLPAWILGLPRIDVRRAVRMTHVLGDSDELLIGARLGDGHELTCAVRLDHTILDDVKDVFVVRDSIETVLAAVMEGNTDPDISFIAMTLADARAWVQTALGRTVFPKPSESRPLVRWLIEHMPEGGQGYERPCDDWQTTSRVLAAFFASPQGRPFSRIDHGELLGELLEAGSGDPLRWSAARIEQVLAGLCYYDDHLSVECLLDAPDLLRAFVPVAHALSGIREGLTARALDMIDQMEPGFQRRIIAEAKRRDDDDDELWAV